MLAEGNGRGKRERREMDVHSSKGSHRTKVDTARYEMSLHLSNTLRYSPKTVDRCSTRMPLLPSGEIGEIVFVPSRCRMGRGGKRVQEARLRHALSSSFPFLLLIRAGSLTFVNSLSPSLEREAFVAFSLPAPPFLQRRIPANLALAFLSFFFSFFFLFSKNIFER